MALFSKLTELPFSVSIRLIVWVMTLLLLTSIEFFTVYVDIFSNLHFILTFTLTFIFYFFVRNSLTSIGKNKEWKTFYTCLQELYDIIYSVMLVIRLFQFLCPFLGQQPSLCFSVPSFLLSSGKCLSTTIGTYVLSTTLYYLLNLFKVTFISFSLTMSSKITLSGAMRRSSEFPSLKLAFFS